MRAAARLDVEVTRAELRVSGDMHRGAPLGAWGGGGTSDEDLTVAREMRVPAKELRFY